MGGWKYSLFSCTENPLMFLWGCCIPGGVACMQGCDAKLALGKDNSFLIACLLACCCGCYGFAYNRYSLKEKMGVDEPIYMTILLGWCLPCCSIHQEYLSVMDDKKGNKDIKIWELRDK